MAGEPDGVRENGGGRGGDEGDDMFNDSPILPVGRDEDIELREVSKP